MNLTYWADGHTHVRRYPGSANTVRVLAHPGQLPLLTKVARNHVEVCSVNQLGDDPDPGHDYALDCMSKCTAPPDQGGWRPLGCDEFTALAFASAVGDGAVPFPPPRDLVARLIAHPLVRGGVGYATGNTFSVGLFTLMREVYDIRRFSHPVYVNRSGRLRSYFRLSGPKHVLELYGAIPPLRNSEAYRVSVIVGSWFVQPLILQPRELIESHPAFFLYRDYYAHYDELSKVSPDMTARGLALWKSTLRYLTFIHQLWLSAVSDSYEFDPDRFFETAKEAEGFKGYIEGVDRLLDNSIELM